MTRTDTTDHARALEVLGKITPGRWLAANMVHAERGDRMTPEELGEYVANSVKRSRAEGGTDDFLFITTPGDDVPDICHVGNGPTGPHNARAIAVTPQFVALFAAAVELEAADAAVQNAAFGGQHQFGSLEYIEAIRAAKARKKAAIAAHKTAIAAVTKGVLNNG